MHTRRDKIELRNSQLLYRIESDNCILDRVGWAIGVRLNACSSNVPKRPASAPMRIWKYQKCSVRSNCSMNAVFECLTTSLHGISWRLRVWYLSAMTVEHVFDKRNFRLAILKNSNGSPHPPISNIFDHVWHVRPSVNKWSKIKNVVGLLAVSCGCHVSLTPLLAALFNSSQCDRMPCSQAKSLLFSAPLPLPEAPQQVRKGATSLFGVFVSAAIFHVAVEFCSN